MKSREGFSLIEVMIVASIIGILATTLILNFRSGSRQTALRQVTQQVVSDIRRAQALAVASRRFKEAPRCGYGVSRADTVTYVIYVGPDSGSVDCKSANRNYESGTDDIFEQIKLLNSNVEFIGSFPDIFYEPPDPKTYIDNNPSASPAQISLGLVGGSCPDDCSTISVTPAGLVEVK